MLTLEITDRAEADIEEIYFYIAVESYQSYAESFASLDSHGAEFGCVDQG